MASLAKLNGITETLPSIPRPLNAQKTQKRMKTARCLSEKTEEFHHPIQTTRRVAIGLASIALTGSSSVGMSLADDNGFWLTSPLPVPSVNNKEIANEETGTRSFLKKGIYMANIGVKGSSHRLRRYAFDLLALGDLIGKNAENYVGKYLRLKSTFMYYDFDKVISAASVNDKQPLIDLANRLFDSVEKLEDVVKKKDLPRTEACYKSTTIILQEVMGRMA